MDHEGYARKTRGMSVRSLEFTIKDCKEALKEQPDSPNFDYYCDEINYCQQELKRRV
jgi:hypothetical protein|tara:strand:+ start:84 stop:254 length:171 start_codon:yes stop_codon:yes gene_type:complete